MKTRLFFLFFLLARLCYALPAPSYNGLTVNPGLTGVSGSAGAVTVTSGSTAGSASGTNSTVITSSNIQLNSTNPNAIIGQVGAGLTGTASNLLSGTSTWLSSGGATATGSNGALVVTGAGGILLNGMNVAVSSIVIFGNTNAILSSTTSLAIHNAQNTATRDVFLPLAATTATGQRITIVDISGTGMTAHGVFLLPSGSDTVNGNNQMTSAYESSTVISDGSGTWNQEIKGVGDGGTGITTLGLGVQGALGRAVNSSTGFMTYAYATGSTSALNAASLVATTNGSTGYAVLNSGDNSLPYLAPGPNSVLYTEGSSQDRGANLSGAQLPLGGLTGNYSNLIGNSFWGANNLTVFNDGVDGSTSAQALARYTTGNSTYGVSVPSPHQVAISGSYGGRKYFIISGSLLYNDAHSSVTTGTTIANMVALTGSAHADGYYVIVTTCQNLFGFGNTQANSVISGNQAIASGSIGADLIAPMDKWLPDQNNTNFYPDGIHASALGHQFFAANFLAFLIHGGGDVDPSFGVSQEPVVDYAGLTVDYLAGNGLTVNGPATFSATNTLSLPGGFIGVTTGNAPYYDFYNDGTYIFGVTSLSGARTILYNDNQAGASVVLGGVNSSHSPTSYFTAWSSGSNVSYFPLTVSGLVTDAGETASAIITANAGILASSGTVTGPLATNAGLAGTTGTFSGPLAANAGFTSTTGTYSASLAVAGASAGTFTLTSGTSKIVNAALTTTSTILTTIGTKGGTPGTYQPEIIVYSGSAAITGLSTDTSTYNYRIIY
jgi:hypothetical protein